MEAKNILFLGFGDIASRACALLPDHRLVGVARSTKKMPPSVEVWQGAADGVAILAKLATEPFDGVVITLTPTDFSDKAYQVAYVDTVKALVRQWQLGPKPGLVIFTSSTSVYEQNDGEWVDENSATEPVSFSGRRLLEAEQCLVASGLPVCMLRVAGIYGPGRDFLLRQVRARQGGGPDFTNRIHADDCAAVIVHLLRRSWTKEPVEPVYLACDHEPASSKEVRSWLATRMGIDPSTLQPSESTRGGNKRCSNRRLLDTGFEFQYPTYREGYGELLADSGKS